ncbi:MAG: CDP-glucose 4,6-dehydratase [Bacteroidetes bacterium]|nr:MAG: CDP-glucose 4,6-dehydratase [Bacteroidota bacterium]
MFNNIYQNKKVLVTGNTGFKGSWLVAWLLKLGAKVIGISKDIPTKPSLFEELRLSEKINDYRQDIRNLAELRAIFEAEKPDFVFHLAAQPIVSLSYSDPVDTFSSNVMGTTHVLEALRHLQNPCVAIIITSDKCYDNVEWVWGYKETDALGGKDIYSASKGAAELVFKSYFHSFFKKENSLVKIASARAGNVIGGGDWAKDRIVPDAVRSWAEGKAVIIRSPNATRPWQHVLEPVAGYLNLGQNLSENANFNGESFNFGPRSEQSHSVAKLLTDLSKFWHFENENQAYQAVGEVKFHEAGLLKLNCDKALFYLKWLPTLDYSELIRFTSQWYYEFYQKNTDILALTFSQIAEYEQFAIKQNIKWTS